MVSKTFLVIAFAIFAAETLAAEKKQLDCRELGDIAEAREPKDLLNNGVTWRLLASTDPNCDGVNITFARPDIIKKYEVNIGPIFGLFKCIFLPFYREDDDDYEYCVTTTRLVATFRNKGVTITRDFDFVNHNSIVYDYDRTARLSYIGRIVAFLAGENGHYCYYMCNFVPPGFILFRCYGVGTATFDIIQKELGNVNLGATPLHKCDPDKYN